MKPSELKILNVVKYYGHTAVVSAIELHSITIRFVDDAGQYVTKEVSTLDINPIPLSIEILENYGMVKTNPNTFPYQYALPDDNLKFKSQWFSVIYYSENQPLSYKGIELKYQHQLQNLYQLIYNNNI